MKPWQRKLVDIAERTFWTAAEAAVAYVGTRLVDLPPSYVLLAAPALAALKGFIAVHVGKHDDAAIAPGV